MAIASKRGLTDYDVLGHSMDGRVTPRQLVQAWVEAFNRADVDGLATLYGEQATNHQVAEAPVVGRSAIREMGLPIPEVP